MILILYTDERSPDELGKEVADGGASRSTCCNQSLRHPKGKPDELCLTFSMTSLQPTMSNYAMQI